MTWISNRLVIAAEDKAVIRLADEKPIHILSGRLAGMQGAEGNVEGGWSWKVDIIKAGVSGNDWHWTEKVLTDAIPLFEGCRAFAHERGGHVWPEDRRVQDMVGSYSDVSWESGGLRATLNITETGANRWIRDNLVAMEEAGTLDHIQLSIHALTRADLEEVGEFGDPDFMIVWLPTEIVKVYSTDLVVEGAAGGRFIEMAASTDNNILGDLMNLKAMLEQLKELRPDLYATIDVKTATEAEVTKLIGQALKESADLKKAAEAKEADDKAKKEAAEAARREGGAPSGDPTPDPPPPSAVPDATAQAVIEATEAAKVATEAARSVEVREARVHLTEKLQGANLPETAQKFVRNAFEAQVKAKIIPTAEQITTMVQDQRDLVASLFQDAPSSIPRVEVNAEEHDKMQSAMMGLLSGQKEDDVEPFMNLTDAFHQISGVAMPTARQVFDEAGFFAHDQMTPKQRVAMESLKTSDLGQILGDSVARMMIRSYSLDDLSTWRNAVSDIIPISDFRTQHRMRLGGYGVLPVVVERGTYQPLTSPADEEETYAISKKGGTEDLTFEMVANDDIRALRNIPRALGTAAAETLYQGVFDLFTDNSAMGDGDAWFHANHNNLGSTALANAELGVIRRAMMDQTPYGNSTTPLGGANVPDRCFIPAELEETTWQLAQPWTKGQGEHDSTSRNANFHAGRFQVWVVNYWTDANDHYWMADPRRQPTIEVGFYQGRQDPELFVQDTPTTGSVFDADKITYKIRHIWGVDVLEHRSAYGEVVA